MFHKTILGLFGSTLPTDQNGFVPESGDRPEEFNFGHDEFVADFDTDGNGYEGAAADAWAAFVSDAEAKTQAAQAALKEWRRNQCE